MDMGFVRFDCQIALDWAAEEPFARVGDSGSLIVDAGTRLAVGLLFAVTDTGGSNGRGWTYAHPLRAVLDALKVDLLTE